MTTTGTTSFDPQFSDLVEEAYERCGVEARTGNSFRTARRSLNLLLLEWANRGINLWTVDSATQVLTAGIATYTLPADTVDLVEAVIRTTSGTTNTDYSITRIAFPVFAALPNKAQSGRPLQFLVTRTATPSFTLWPVPDSTTVYSLVYWRLRRLEEAGNAGNTQDIPFRFAPALVSGLAYYLYMKSDQVDPNRLQILKATYDEQWDLASREDRDKAPVRFRPRVYRL